MNVTPATNYIPFQQIHGLLLDAQSVTDSIADTFTLKGGNLPSATSVMSARDEAMRASMLLWDNPLRTGDLTGTTVENSSILALRASESLGRIAEEMTQNTPQYGGPNGPSHMQIDAVVAQNALRSAIAGVNSLQDFMSF